MNSEDVYKKILETKNQSKIDARKSMHKLLKKQTKALGLEYIMITDDEIKSKDYTNVHQFFKKLERTWRVYKGKVMIVVDGYDNTTDELYEISEVSDYFKKLYYEKPHYLFFLNDVVESFSLALLFLSSKTTTIKPIYKDDDKTLIEKIEENIKDLTDFEKNHIFKITKSYITIEKETYEKMIFDILNWFYTKNDIDLGLKLIEDINNKTFNM